MKKEKIKNYRYILNDILQNNVCLGYREKEVLQNVKKITLIMNNKQHEVYKIENDNNYIEYDKKTKLIVG